MSQADLEPEILHRTAVLALLVARLASQGSVVAVYTDGVPESPEFPYLVGWSAAGDPVAGAERMAGYGGEISTSTQLTAAGLTPDGVIGAVGRARRALHRQQPTVPGRVCGDITVSTSGGGPVPDPAPGPGGLTVYSLPIYVELTSSPSS